MTLRSRCFACPAQEAELLNMESDKDFDLVGAAALHMRTAACQYGRRHPQLLLVCQQPQPLHSHV